MKTCGPACMLMLLDLYGKIEYPTPKQEMKLYSLYRSKVFKGIAVDEQVQRLSATLRHVDLEITLDMKNLVFQEFSDMNHYETVL